MVEEGKYKYCASCTGNGLIKQVKGERRREGMGGKKDLGVKGARGNSRPHIGKI